MSGISENAEHQHEERHNEQRKWQHHPHALEIASLYLLVVCFDITLPLAGLRALPSWP